MKSEYKPALIEKKQAIVTSSYTALNNPTCNAMKGYRNHYFSNWSVKLLYIRAQSEVHLHSYSYEPVCNNLLG